MPFANQVTAGVQFARKVMQSLGFQAGVTGWQLKRNGDAQFNNVTLTGAFSGTNYVINATGEFRYSASPALGNLIYTDTTTGGTDGQGNVYLPGVTVYSNLGGTFVANNLSTTSQVSWWTAPAAGGPWTEVASITADTVGDLIIACNDRFGAASPLLAVLAGGVFETWHSLGSPSATGYTSLGGRYRYEAIGPGYTVLEIQLLANAGGGTAGVYTYASALPAGYQFPGSGSKSEPLGFNGTVAAGSNFGSALIDGAAAGSPGRVRIDIPGLPAGTVIGATIWIPLS
jgi:hypothetical protein